MKVTFQEENESFWLTIEAETIEDAHVITRFGLNKTKEFRYSEAFACNDGKFIAQMSFGKVKQVESIITRARKIN